MIIYRTMTVLFAQTNRIGSITDQLQKSADRDLNILSQQQQRAATDDHKPDYVGSDSAPEAPRRASVWRPLTHMRPRLSGHFLSITAGRQQLSNCPVCGPAVQTGPTHHGELTVNELISSDRSEITELEPQIRTH